MKLRTTNFDFLLLYFLNHTLPPCIHVGNSNVSRRAIMYFRLFRPINAVTMSDSHVK